MTNVNNIVDFPNETLFHLFSFCDLQTIFRSQQVCKRFYLILNDGSFWKKLCENAFSSNRLIQSDWKQDRSQSQKTSKRFYKLLIPKYLMNKFCKKDLASNSVEANWKNRYVSLHRSKFESSPKHNENLKQFLELRAKEKKTPTDEEISTKLKENPYATHFSLKKGDDIYCNTDQALRPLTLSGEFVSIEFKSLGPHSFQFSGKSIQEVVQANRYLRSLTIEGCYNLTSGNLKIVLEKCDRLKSLTLQKSLLSDGDVEQISNHCTSLNSLTLFGTMTISDKGLSVLGELAKKLNNLDLRIFPSRTFKIAITDRGIETFMKSVGHLFKLTLDLACPMSPSFIDSLDLKQSRLTEITLWKCQNLTEKDIEKITSITSLSTICLDKLNEEIAKRYPQIIRF